MKTSVSKDNIVSVKPHGNTNALLLTEDGYAIFGFGFGATSKKLGELCFNTAMSGYQEILSDPSYAGQIISFTCPHIGNVGCNPDDMESARSFASGAVVRERIAPHSNHRATGSLSEWLKAQGVPGISAVDTRSLTRRIRDHGALKALLLHQDTNNDTFNLPALLEEVRGWAGLVGADLAGEVSCREAYEWKESLWKESPWKESAWKGRARQNGSESRASGGAVGGAKASAAGGLDGEAPHIVAVDYGVKHNILRMLVAHGARVTVVPAQASAEQILALAPDGVFLSNGPGDPAATGVYAEPTLAALMEQKPHLPVFGICLGHQILGRTLGLDTEKLSFGHHGANHPVLEIASGCVLITSQNHNFCIQNQKLPDSLTLTHKSLFDHTNQGIHFSDGRPVFSVQFHPEASPGPHDAQGLFARFMDNVQKARDNQFSGQG